MLRLWTADLSLQVYDIDMWTIMKTSCLKHWDIFGSELIGRHLLKPIDYWISSYRPILAYKLIVEKNIKIKTRGVLAAEIDFKVKQTVVDQSWRSIVLGVKNRGRWGRLSTRNEWCELVFWAKKSEDQVDVWTWPEGNESRETSEGEIA